MWLKLVGYHGVHRETYDIGQAGSVTFIKGRSGSGKTRLVNGIEFCIYGEGDVNTNATTSSLASLVSAELFVSEDLVFTRVVENKKTKFTVKAGQELFEDQRAEAWVQDRLMSSAIWGQSVFCGIRRPIPFLLTSGNEDKLAMLREVSFGTRSSEIHVIKEEVKRIQHHLTEAEGAMRVTEMPRFTSDRQETSEEASRALAAIQPFVHTLEGTYGEELARNNVLRGKLQGVVASKEQIAVDPAYIAKFQELGEGLVAGWMEFVGKLQKLTERRQLFVVHGAEIRLLKEELHELGYDEASEISATVGTDQERYARQCNVARKLGLDPETVTEKLWDRTREDLTLVKAHYPSAVDYIQARTARASHKREELPAVPSDIEHGRIAALSADIKQTMEILEDCACTDHADGLRAAVADRQMELNAQLRSHEEAIKWSKKIALYNELRKRQPKEVDMKKLAEFKRLQSESQSMTCPSCRVTLVVKDRKLERANARKVDISSEELQEKIDNADREHANYMECAPMLQEIKQIITNPAFKDAAVLTEEELKQIRATVYKLESVANRSQTLDMSADARLWLLHTAERYLERCFTEHSDAAYKAESIALKREEARLRTIFGDLIVAVETGTQLLDRWWPLAGQRVLTSHILRQDVPPLFCPRPLGEGAARALDVQVEIRQCNARLADLNDNGVEFDIPDFPVFPNLDKEFFGEAKDIAKLNGALVQAKTIAALVQKTWVKFRAWEDAGKARALVEEIQLELTQSTGALEVARAEVVRSADAERERNSLSTHIMYLAQKNKYEEAVATLEDLREDLTGAKDLLNLAQEAESEVLEGKAEQLTMFANEFLQEFFTEEISITVATSRVLKTSQAKKPTVTTTLQYKNRTIEKMQHISSGEQARVALAIAGAFAMLHPFPLLVVDDSLALVEYDLRQQIVSALKARFPDKCIVIILQDRNLNAFDNFIDLTKPQ